MATQASDREPDVTKQTRFDEQDHELVRKTVMSDLRSPTKDWHTQTPDLTVPGARWQVLNMMHAECGFPPQYPLHPRTLEQFFAWEHAAFHSTNSYEEYQKYAHALIANAPRSIIAMLPPVQACLFDMDGLLIDSEDIYSEVTNSILRRYGRADMPWSVKAQLQGRPGPQATEIFMNWAKIPISVEEYNAQQQALQMELFPNTKLLPGVADLLQNLTSYASNQPKIGVALATSSNSVNYDLKLTNNRDFFLRSFEPAHVIRGDDPRIPKARGKPAPDIYLLALRTLNEVRTQHYQPLIRPFECLVFEDSVPGVEAARRAGMRVVWVPYKGLLNEYRGQEHLVLAGRTGKFSDPATGSATVGEDLAAINAAASPQMNPGLNNPPTHINGWPGSIGDGFGELLGSLEEFDYAKYGIHLSAVAPQTMAFDSTPNPELYGLPTSHQSNAADVTMRDDVMPSGY